MKFVLVSSVVLFLLISSLSVNCQLLDKLHVFDLKANSLSAYEDFTLSNSGKPVSVFSFGFSNFVFFENSIAVFGDNQKSQLIFNEAPSVAFPRLYYTSLTISDISCGETFCISPEEQYTPLWGNFISTTSLYSQVIDFPVSTIPHSTLKAGRDHCSFFVPSTNTVYTVTANGWSSQIVPFAIRELYTCSDYNILVSDVNDLYIQIITTHWGFAENTIISGVKNITFESLTCGWNAVFLIHQGKVDVFGVNEFGEFGDGDQSSEIRLDTLQSVPLPENIIQVSYSRDITAALTETGEVYSWGMNNPIIPFSFSPQKLSFSNNVTSISVGICHLIVLDESGLIWTVGCNENYACASTEIILTQPKQLYFRYMIPSSIVMLSRTTEFLTYVSNKGELYARGVADKNQIGFSNIGYVSAASKVPFYSSMYIRKALSAGNNSIVISSQSNLYLMGPNTKIRYGNVLTNENVLVHELQSNVLDACIGNSFIAILSVDQSLYLLGEFSMNRYDEPTLLDNEVTSISCLSASSILAYRKQNQVLIWPSNLASFFIDADHFAVMKNGVLYSKNNQLFSISSNQSVCSYFEFASPIIQMVVSKSIFAVELDSGIVYTAYLNSTNSNCEQPTLLNFTIPVYNTSQWDVLMSSYDSDAFRRVTISQVPICFGKHMFPTQPQSIDKYPCGGISRGQCVAYNQCQCQQGYVGAECNEFACYGKAHMDQNVCNGNGMCNEPNNCLCLPGYYGSDCAIPACFNQLANETSKVCSGNGKCVDRNLCTCNWLHLGEECTDKHTMPLILFLVIVVLPCSILCAILVCIVPPLIITLVVRKIQKKYNIDKALIEELQQDENIEDEKYSLLRKEIEHATNFKWINNLAGNGIHGFQLGDRLFVAKIAKADEYTHGMKFRHQNLLPWLALREFNGSKYVINERLTGTLDNYLNDATIVQKHNAHKIALQSCFGLAVLHYKHKLVHRDIKNQNILVNYNIETLEVEIVKLFDFDACKKADDKDWNVCEQKFSLEYCAPEIHMRNISNPYLIDIYSLGVVFQKLFKDTDELCIKMTNRVPEKRPKNILLVIKELVRRIQQEKLSSALESDLNYASVICKAFETKEKSARTMSKTNRQSTELQTLKKPLLDTVN